MSYIFGGGGGGGGSTSIAVNSTPITGGTNLEVLYDNAGTVGEYTNVQLTAAIQPFSSTLSGAVPASGGLVANVLRGDGTWGAITPALPTTSIQYNNGGVFGGDSSFFFNNVNKGVFAFDVYTGHPTYLIRTSTTLIDGSAGQTATLTNSPVMGNPTKWIAIDDNGTTVYIPVWSLTPAPPLMDFSKPTDSQYLPMGGLAA